ncbi:MAG TPA: L,D-transpeptidase [Solirubrobacteraceae bacterium]|nr:L,D-transpeptidase [Solirubrobacteraceae bacterium]
MPRSRRSRRVLPVFALAAAAFGAVAAGTVTTGGSVPAPAGAETEAARSLPSPVTPAFVPGPPRRLGSTRHLSWWAPVRRPVVARTAPDATAAVVTAVGTRTPDGTANVLSVIRQRGSAAGRLWVQVRLPVLPNGTTGWVPRRALGGYGTVDTRLDVDLRRLRATLFRAGRPVFRAAVGIGAPQWATPTGTFYVRSKLTRYRSPFYGPVAFATSARSPTLTDWPGGGFVGIHGTNRPDQIPGAVSHGCIRLRNADILALARLMPVGTPLTIH